jgi:hypothetical protein
MRRALQDTRAHEKACLFEREQKRIGLRLAID